jgi:basic membrane protein A
MRSASHHGVQAEYASERMLHPHHPHSKGENIMRKSKRVAALALTASLFVVAACGSDDETTTTEAPGASTAETTAPADGGKAGIAFDTGGRGDGTFNDSAAAGADKAEAELGVTVQELEATTDEDRKPNLEALTAEGNNPVIAVGFLFSDTLAALAPANPDTTYGIIDGFVDPAVAPNVINLGFAEEQGSFLVGAAAALKSESGIIGFIGGQEIDLIKKFEAGYIAGAKAINPDIEVKSQYLGAAGDNAAWGSPDKAKEIALGWYAEGADIIYTAAGGSGNGTIEAAVEADKWAIGVDSDQYLTASSEEAKGHILTSMLKRVDVAVFETIKSVTAGEAIENIRVFDLSVDGVGYATSGGYIDDIVPQLEELKAKIISGEITVPTNPADA